MIALAAALATAYWALTFTVPLTPGLDDEGFTGFRTLPIQAKGLLGSAFLLLAAPWFFVGGSTQTRSGLAVTALIGGVIALAGVAIALDAAAVL